MKKIFIILLFAEMAFNAVAQPAAFMVKYMNGDSEWLPGLMAKKLLRNFSLNAGWEYLPVSPGL